MLCGHSVLYSETWPTSGSMRNGKSYPPPRPGLRIAGSGYSSSPGLLPTPTAQLNAPAEWKPDVDWWLQSRAARNLEAIVTGSTPMLKTPTAQLAVNGGSQHPDKRRGGGHGPTLADQVEHELLPTPNAAPIGSEVNTRVSGDGREKPNKLGWAIGALLPTPRATDGTKGGPNQRGSSGDLMLPSAVMELLPTPDTTKWKTTRTGPLLHGIADLLPTPAAHDSGNSPENHLRKKPGREQVTSLAIIAENGLIETGGRLLPTPTAMHTARNATANRRPDSTGHAGTTLADVFWTGDLTDQP